MKKLLSIICLSLSFIAGGLFAFGQNVGINEPAPAAKLTVKASAYYAPAFLVKTSDNDSSLLVTQNYLFAGNASANYGPQSVFTIANKYNFHGDGAHLNLLATGLKTPGNANGSLSDLMFSNNNYGSRFFVSANNAPGEEQLTFLQNDISSGTFKFLLKLKANGQAGLGTYDPRAALQINHRISGGEPTLLLFDSAGTDLPVVQFTNALNPTRHWQLSGYMGAAETDNFFDISTQTGIKLTVNGIGNLGIGDSSPEEKLVVSGNIKLSGEVNRATSGTANLVPLCYGNVTSTAIIQPGGSTENFTVTRISAGRYNISISGETFNINSYHATATPIGSNPVFITTGSGGGILNITTYNLSGVATDNSFCFTVYKR